MEIGRDLVWRAAEMYNGGREIYNGSRWRCSLYSNGNIGWRAEGH
jgi:hypothetical protein